MIKWEEEKEIQHETVVVFCVIKYYAAYHITVGTELQGIY